MSNKDAKDSSDEEQDETSKPEYYYNQGKIPTYKVILLGEAGSGKTSLFWRYKYGSFNKGTTLQGTDRFRKEFVNDSGERVQVCLDFYIVLVIFCWRLKFCNLHLYL
jgi:GTPase SAR1 family protein